MDAVITYVDGLDPLWQEDYRRTVGDSILKKRFRDWGTLKYLLRGIHTYMPFVRNIYLVVARESQIPEWVDRSRLNIVLHSDIIPKEYLPTFNSTTIELFLHRIPGLDEEYVYFNDDVFPVAPCREQDFFEEGRAHIPFRFCHSSRNLFKQHCANSDALAAEAALHFGPLPANAPAPPTFLRPQHGCSCMLKSRCEELFELKKDALFASISPIRESRNINQYVFPDYLFYRGFTHPAGFSCKHISLAVIPAFAIHRYIVHPRKQFVCINDVQMVEKRFARYRRSVLKAFEEAFPVPSPYEI